MNKAYSLSEDREVVEREASPEELKAARDAAEKRLKEKAGGSGWAMRSCWNCNHAHRHFLENLSDGFLFSCVMGCGRWYYQGIDITESDEEVADPQ